MFLEVFNCFCCVNCGRTGDLELMLGYVIQIWSAWYLMKEQWVSGVSPAVLCLMSFFKKPFSLLRTSHFQSQGVQDEFVVVFTDLDWVVQDCIL